MGEADVIRTGGIKPFVHPLMAHIALLRDTFCGIKCDRVIRAGIDTQPAAGTAVRIDLHDAPVDVLGPHDLLQPIRIHGIFP